ncbi:MAG: DnaB-like helicase N-terminal domain-containing protein [Pirellulales bacterium]
MKTGTMPPLPARDANEAAFAEAEPDSGIDWVQYHGAGQQKHQSAIGQGHSERQQKQETEREYPRDDVAEKGVLASILLKPSVMDDVAAILQADDFFDPNDRHGVIYAHMSALHADGLPIDLALLGDRLRQSDDLERVGGHAYLHELFRWEPTAANAIYYAEVITRHSMKRGFALLCERSVADAKNGHAPAELLDKLTRGIDRLGERATAKRFEVITSTELETGNYQLEYLVDGVLAKGQHAMLAGMYKVLKTTIAIDLAIALAACGMFLGFFRVLRPARVLFMSAESGLATIQETARRICRKAGLRLEELDGLLWSTDLPRPHKAGDMAALRTLLKRERVDVLLLDPAYLMLPGDDVANLFKQGEVLAVLSGVCGELGVTLILVHHAKKTVAAQYEPMELADAAMAGFAEFSRQWILLSRREKYEPGSGIHRLWLNIGGSAGHGGLHGVDVDEGTGHGNRHWSVQILDPSECRKEEEERRQGTKEEKLTTKDEALLNRVLALLLKAPDGDTTTALRERLAVGPLAINRATALGLDRGELEACEVVKPNRKAPYAGFRIPQKALSEAV